MLEGGCFCGAVRYQIDGPLGSASACHCSRCRKMSGGAASAFVGVPSASKLSWASGEHELTLHTDGKGWGLAFCRICGSTLAGMFDGKVQGVTLGTIDGDPGVQIEKHTFVGSKAPWDHIGGSAPQFEAEAPKA